MVLPAGPPRNPNAGGPNNEVHNAGEVWCCALWEVFVNLVAKHGHAEAEQRMLKYVIGGLKLTPSQPTFMQARDAIISAASGTAARGRAADLERLRQAGHGKERQGAAALFNVLDGGRRELRRP